MPDNAEKKTILITGATGYIGRRLTQRLLVSGCFDVRLFVRNKNKVQAAVRVVPVLRLFEIYVRNFR